MLPVQLMVEACAGMFGAIPTDEFEVVSASGEYRGKITGVFSPKSLTVHDAKAVILAGDELRRKIENGTEEAYEVIEPVFYKSIPGIPAHFQIRIQRKGIFEAGKGGNYTINVAGPNSRVSINSTDQSSNVVSDNRVFNDIRTAISDRVADAGDRALLLEKIDALEAAQSDKSSFLKSYQDLIANAANHMTVVAPFLPMLTQMLG